MQPLSQTGMTKVLKSKDNDWEAESDNELEALGFCDKLSVPASFEKERGRKNYPYLIIETSQLLQY